MPTNFLVEFIGNTLLMYDLTLENLICSISLILKLSENEQIWKTFTD